MQLGWGVHAQTVGILWPSIYLIVHGSPSGECFPIPAWICNGGTSCCQSRTFLEESLRQLPYIIHGSWFLACLINSKFYPISRLKLQPHNFASNPSIDPNYERCSDTRRLFWAKSQVPDRTEFWTTVEKSGREEGSRGREAGKIGEGEFGTNTWVKVSPIYL